MFRQLIAVALTSLATCASIANAAPEVYEFTFDSEAYPIDQIYRSMMGPKGRKLVQLMDEGLAAELIWIVGYRTDIVGGDGDAVLSAEFMCHNNLNLAELDRHVSLFNWPQANPRLFTLSQGQMEVRFPEGFGIPIHSHEKLAASTQVLNLNPQPKAFDVRHRTTLLFVRDAEVETPMRALYQTAAQGLVSLGQTPTHFNVDEPDSDKHGPGCSVGQIAGDRVIKDRFDREFTGHWIVKPGREVNRTLVSGYLRLPQDTRAHYIAVHLHPFAESLELRDLTTGESVFKSKAQGPQDKIGLTRVEHFESEEGLPIRKDHIYELVSTYNNTSGKDQDAMAVMFLYLHDTQFVKPVFE
jgi:hypothetical protein